MSEDKVYKDGDIVWVKLGNNWWPGEVTGPSRHPEGLIKHLKRVPYCVVKFFNENSYEYIRSAKQIFPFQCTKKDEFLKKGYSLYNSGNTFMEKFPEDVEVAERLTRRKESSLVINNRPDSIVKAILGQPLITTYDSCYDETSYREQRRSGDSVTKILNITQNRNSTSNNDKQGTSTNSLITSSIPLNNTKYVATNNVCNTNTHYQCNLCDFTSVRQNVMILHRKMHSNRNSTGTTSFTKSSPESAKNIASNTPTMGVNKNVLNQNQTINNEKTKNKTKVITTTEVVSRSEKDIHGTTETIIRTTTSKEQDNTQSINKTNKSKSPKLNNNKKSVRESKTESAYDTILSDFCPSETESSPRSDDKQSRRSLRNRKNSLEASTVDITNGSPICIDISETRSIQKIPKKRDFSSLQLRKQIHSEVSDPDVCIIDKDKEITTKTKCINTSVISPTKTTREDAEDLRKILLADWSDDDDSPTDAIVVDDILIEDIAESNECVAKEINEPNRNTVAVLTSKPVVESTSLSTTARIRNIPKKDRRDVVLQDFNSDLSLIQDSNNVTENKKPIAVDLESSNSSVVEIIEDEQPAAPIITINDDEEELDDTRTQKDQNSVVVCESGDSDFATNKTNSAAHSSCTVSCFDFQEEEDEQEIATPTISHFKKKYLSSEKLQNLSSTDDMDDENAVKIRAEVAEKDQKLAAEIESLLAQTQPPITDLLNANSLEESISVKDLPIKERGKRIFKSRNKSRMEEKSTEAVIPATLVEGNIKAVEQDMSKENPQVEAINTNEKETVEIANTVDKDVIPEVEENLIPTKTARETATQEVFSNAINDLPTYLENDTSANEDISKSDNSQTVHVERDQLVKEQLLTSEEDVIEKENILKEVIQTVPPEQIEIADLSEILTTNTTFDNKISTTDQDINVSDNHNVSNGEEEIGKSLYTAKENDAIVCSELAPNENAEFFEMPETLEKQTVTEQEIIALNKEKNSETANIGLLTYEENKTEKIHDNDNIKLSAEETTIESKTVEEVREDIKENEILENLYKIRVKSSEQLFEQEIDLEPEQSQDTLRANDVRIADTRLIATTPTDENSSMGASDTGAEFGSPTSMLSEERLPAFRFESNQTPQQGMDNVENDLHLIENSKQTTKETMYNDTNHPNDLLKKTPFNSANHNENCLSIHNPLTYRRFSMDLNSVRTEANVIKRPRLSVDERKINCLNNLDKTLERNSSFKPEINYRPKNRHMKITPRRNVSELFKRQMNGNPSNNNDIDTSTQKTIHTLQESKEELSIKPTQRDGSDENENIENIENDKRIVEINVKTKEPEVNENFAGENVSKEGEKINKDVLCEALEHEADQTHDNGKKEKVLENYSAINEMNADGMNKELQSDKKTGLQSNQDNWIRIEKTPMDLLTEVVTAEETEISWDQKRDQSTILTEESENNIVETVVSYSTDNTGGNDQDKKETEEVNSNFVENSDLTSTENHRITLNNTEDVKSNEPGNIIAPSLDEIEAPLSPGTSPPTPQECEIVIKCDNLNESINEQQQQEGCENKDNTLNHLTTPNKSELINSKIIETLITNEANLIKEVDETSSATMESMHEGPSPAHDNSQDHKHETSKDEIQPPKTDQSQNILEDENTIVLLTASSEKDECENQKTMSSTPQEKDECENSIAMPSIPQVKVLIIECEPATPQSIIECDNNMPAQITPEKEIIIESNMETGISSPVTLEKNIIIEENLPLEEKESLIEREFREIQPKQHNIVQERQTNALQTDDDKAAEEFLIEFDSIVNHSQSVEDDTPNNSIEEVINSDDLINNIIEEVAEEVQVKQDTSKDESPVSTQYETDETFTVVAEKPSWNQVFKESFTKQSTPAKRRQTICFEISGTSEDVTCKKQALDFETVLPVNKTPRRCAERKLTLPAIETQPSNNNLQHGLSALNHNQLTLNKKLIPASKRKLSIEDNITSFIIKRPKQQQQIQIQTTSGPPPLQRIGPLSRQAPSNARTNEDNKEHSPQQSHDNLYQELFYPIPSSPTPCQEPSQRPEGARVIHQQILSSPGVTTIPTKPSADSKIAKNKQIGVDSRGNKYVIIKTPPTDIIVQPTLTSSSTAAVTATNNFGTAITLQPLPRTSTEAATTKSAKNKTSTTASSVRKQQQQQQMQHISITLPAKSPVEISKSSDVVNKTALRNKRKTTQTKTISTGAAATNSNNINSAKHKQAMEALSRRLSIASDAPPLSKITKTTTTHVQTHPPNSSNLTTFFGDTQITNIAQQQLINLQQQQQHPPASQLPPPIILNKNAHQHSVIKRRPRKLAQQQQKSHQQYNLQQQQPQNAAKSSQLLQLQQQQAQLQQQQQLQQQFLTQITTQQQLQQQQQQQPHNLLQPTPLQQIQPQTVQLQQQQIVQQTDGIIITTTEDDNVIDSNTQLIALPTQPYPGYSETFLLCKIKGNTFKPVDNVPLYLNQQLNELVPVPLEALEGGPKPQQSHQIEIKSPNETQQILAGAQNIGVIQNNENNLQIANITCGITDGEISSAVGVDAGESNLQQHNHNQTQQQIMEECVVEDNTSNIGNSQLADYSENQDVNSELIPNNGILLNIEGQQVLLDAATFAHLLANPDANTQLISDDGTEYVLTHEVLAALQMQQEQQQALELANAAATEQQPHHRLEQASGSDIIAVALAGSDLYDNDVLTIDTSQGMQLIDGDGSIVFPQHTGAMTQQHLTPPAVVTNAVLDQSPIMSTLEVPSSIAAGHKLQNAQLITVPSHHLAASSSAALGGRSNLEDSLAAIGVTAQSSSVPASLGLPITVTNPNIASKVTAAGPLNEMLQFVSHRPATAAATAAAVAAAALAGESRIFTD